MTTQSKQSRILKIVKSEDSPALASKVPSKAKKQQTEQTPKNSPIHQPEDSKPPANDLPKIKKVLPDIPLRIQKEPTKKILPRTPRRIQEEPVDSEAGITIVVKTQKTMPQIDCNDIKIQNILATHKKILTANLQPEVLTLSGTLADNVISVDKIPQIFEGQAKRLVSKITEFLIVNPQLIAPTWEVLTDNKLTIAQKTKIIRGLGWTEDLIPSKGFRSLYILGRLLAN